MPCEIVFQFIDDKRLEGDDPTLTPVHLPLMSSIQDDVKTEVKMEGTAEDGIKGSSPLNYIITQWCMVLEIVKKKILSSEKALEITRSLQYGFL